MLYRLKLSKILLGIGLLSSSLASAAVVSVNDVVTLAQKNSERVKAAELALQSLDAEIRARDLVLSPTLSTDLAMFNDHRQSISSTSGRRGTSGLVDLSLTKPFSTGTTFSLNVGHDLLTSESFAGERNIADWEIRVSQALWRDSFGRGTQLRRSAEQSELKSRRYQILLERQQFVIEVENAFWNLALASREIEVRRETIERSESLERWVRRRIGNFAAETTDLLQVQGLLSQRKLDLTAANNRLEAARSELRQFIPDLQTESLSADLKSLESDRNAFRLIADGADTIQTPIRLDALASRYRADQTKLEAAQVSDSLKPQLDAYASYGANGIEERFSRSWDTASRADYDAARVGLLFSVELDQGLKIQRRKSAELAAASERARSQALSRESQVGWSEIQRNIVNLKAQAKEARELAGLQARKVKAERRRYEQGRTTALQITTFEVDAAESELRLYRILADLRKAESAARLFAFEN